MNEDIDFIGKTLLINANQKKILVIGDLHLGYEGALRESGVFIGSGMLKEYKEYLDKVFEFIGNKELANVRGVGRDNNGEVDRDDKRGLIGNVNNKEGVINVKVAQNVLGDNYVVDEIVLLGDVKHVIGSVINQEWNEVLDFLDYLSEKCKKIIIVKGQHDAILEPILEKRKGIELFDYYISGKYAFLHGDKEFKEIYNAGIKYWIMGNGHPAVKISDKVKIEKYKCFLVGKYSLGIGKGKKEIIICPSFLTANEGSDAREHDLNMAWKFDYDNFKVIAVNGDEDDLKDLDFGKLGELE